MATNAAPQVDVEPDSFGGWRTVAYFLGKRVIRRSRVKHAAVQVGIGMAMILECELIIKDRKGVIREKNSYGNDPKESKG